MIISNQNMAKKQHRVIWIQTLRTDCIDKNR